MNLTLHGPILLPATCGCGNELMVGDEDIATCGRCGCRYRLVVGFEAWHPFSVSIATPAPAGREEDDG